MEKDEQCFPVWTLRPLWKGSFLKTDANLSIIKKLKQAIIFHFWNVSKWKVNNGYHDYDDYVIEKDSYEVIFI